MGYDAERPADGAFDHDPGSSVLDWGRRRGTAVASCGKIPGRGIGSMIGPSVRCQRTERVPWQHRPGLGVRRQGLRLRGPSSSAGEEACCGAGRSARWGVLAFQLRPLACPARSPSGKGRRLFPPYAWYDTPNLHFDHFRLSHIAKKSITVVNKFYLDCANAVRTLPNLLAETGIFCIRRG
jgi:hypothetical protein